MKKLTSIVLFLTTSFATSAYSGDLSFLSGNWKMIGCDRPNIFVKTGFGGVNINENLETTYNISINNSPKYSQRCAKSADKFVLITPSSGFDVEKEFSVLNKKCTEGFKEERNIKVVRNDNELSFTSKGQYLTVYTGSTHIPRVETVKWDYTYGFKKINEDKIEFNAVNFGEAHYCQYERVK